jgi:hypothetical protein
MAVNFFTPSGYATLSVGSTSSNVAVPGSPTSILVTNLGPYPVAVLTGATNAVVVTPATGVIILPNQQIYLAPGAFIAAIALGGGPSKCALYIHAGA